MKAKDKKPFLIIDERNKQIAYRIISIMYFLTIFAMQAIVLYRQFALGQELHEFEDMAILMTVNSLFLISALLYFGAIPIRKLKIKSILLIYALLVTLGSIFTYAKYNLFGSAKLSFSQLFDKLIAVYAITGIIMFFFIIFSILGKRKMEKELE
ncbi:MAG: hypothetical protein KAK04_01790 [Cyclobacteriaceae bacterium]|nr:hypothetical protein [Cyclobacteriaceae bacterium]